MFYQKLRVDGRLTECLTGDRVVYIEPLTSPLPRTIMFGQFKARIFHFGQTDAAKTNTMCSKCLQSGHLRSACMNSVVCRSCKQTGHIEADCPAHATPTDPANQRPENVPSSQWSQKVDPMLRHESHGRADNAPSCDRYETDFPPATKDPVFLLNQRSSNSHPRMTRSRSRRRTSPTTSPSRHQDSARKDRENTRKPRETNTCASDTAYPVQPASPAAPPSEATPNRTAEQSSETADQTAPPKLSNQQQSKITQFIEKARHQSDANREHNGEPADCRVVSDHHSADEEDISDGSDCSREDEFVSAEYSEREEDTITEHHSDLSAESPETVKARDKVNYASKRKQKPKKKTSKKR